MSKNARNVRGQNERHGKKAALFCEVANEWMAVKKLSVKSSTYARYKASLELHILPYLGNRAASKVTTVVISEFANEKLENGRLDKKGGLAANTVSCMLSVIKLILDHALETNKISSPVSVPYPKHQSRNSRVLNREEQDLLESYCTQDTDIYKLGKLLCLYTGIRIGELCALLWKDISLEKGTISISKTMQRVKDNSGGGNKTKIEIGAPKSKKSVRTIPIPKFLVALIRKHAKDRQGFFLATKKGGYTEPRTMQYHFARAIKLLNIPDANFHALRHTFATRCIEAGVDSKSLSEMLGHSSVSITLNLYVHSSFEQKRECIRKLEEYVRSEK